MVKIKAATFTDPMMGVLSMAIGKMSIKEASLKMGFKMFPSQILISESNYKKLCPKKKNFPIKNLPSSEKVNQKFQKSLLSRKKK